MAPPGAGRNVSEIPSRMLRVASVAMIEGIFTPRTRPALTKPTRMPASSTAALPIRIWVPLAPVGMRKEAITTPRLIIDPTERSR